MRDSLVNWTNQHRDNSNGIEIIVTKYDFIQQFQQFMSQFSVASLLEVDHARPHHTLWKVEFVQTARRVRLKLAKANGLTNMVMDTQHHFCAPSHNAH